MSSVLAIEPNDPALVRGTSGEDRLILTPGAQAIGGGGDDVFVLTGGVEGYLGVIHDFSPGDRIDVSALGAGAKVLGLTSPGSQVFAIDFDGDEDADGFLFVFEDHPIPVEPDFPIGGPLSGPMPVDFEPFPIGGPTSEGITTLLLPLGGLSGVTPLGFKPGPMGAPAIEGVITLLSPIELSGVTPDGFEPIVIGGPISEEVSLLPAPASGADSWFFL